jgi:hypothetical protein
MRRNLQPRLTQRQVVIVEIQHVGPVTIDQILHPRQPMRGKLTRRRAFIPQAVRGRMPCRRFLIGPHPIGDRHAGPGIEIAGIEPLPPLPRAIRRGQARGIVTLARARARDVIAIGHLVPVPRMARMVRHSKAQTLGAGQLLPPANDVGFGPDAGRIPGVMRRIVAVEIVMMIGQSHEITRPATRIEIDQRLGLPRLGLPQILHLHEAHIRRMAIGLQMMLIGRVALKIHLPPVPVVADPRHTGRAPMRPDPELGIAEPVGGGISSSQ